MWLGARARALTCPLRLQILMSMGFEFGEVAQLTEEWEHRFDQVSVWRALTHVWERHLPAYHRAHRPRPSPAQLIDWMLWHGENQQVFSWLGVDWGMRGGITARELALWVTLQKAYRLRGLLPTEALSRFEAIGVHWESMVRGCLLPPACDWGWGAGDRRASQHCAPLAGRHRRGARLDGVVWQAALPR